MSVRDTLDVSIKQKRRVVKISFPLGRCSILSLWTAIKGYLFKFGLFTFGRALSSQPTPYQVLKLKLQKLQKDNDDDSTQDCRFLRFTFTFLHDVQNIAPGHK